MGAMRRTGPKDRRPRPGLGVALVLSSAAHILWIAMPQERSSEAPRLARAASSDVEFVVMEEVRPEDPEPFGPPAGRARAKRSTKAVPERIASAVVGRSLAGELRIEPFPGSTVVPGFAEPAAPDLEPKKPAVRLDPRSVALGQIGLSGPSDTGKVPPEVARAEAARRRSAEISADLRAEAAKKSYLSERPPPKLRSTQDGGYVWRGASIAARIHPDGSVTFGSRRVSLDGDEGGGGARYEGLMSARVANPYAAEQRWFLDRTEALRDEMAERSRGRDMSEALSRLKVDLARLWKDDRRSAASRRAMLFAMWDEMSEDQSGARARAVVERFVRTHLPEGSRNAYAPLELEELNRKRRSRSRFEPYGS